MSTAFSQLLKASSILDARFTTPSAVAFFSVCTSRSLSSRSLPSSLFCSRSLHQQQLLRSFPLLPQAIVPQQEAIMSSVPESLDAPVEKIEMISPRGGARLLLPPLQWKPFPAVIAALAMRKFTSATPQVARKAVMTRFLLPLWRRIKAEEDPSSFPSTSSYPPHSQAEGGKEREEGEEEEAERKAYESGVGASMRSRVLRGRGKDLSLLHHPEGVGARGGRQGEGGGRGGRGGEGDVVTRLFPSSQQESHLRRGGEGLSQPQVPISTSSTQKKTEWNSFLQRQEAARVLSQLRLLFLEHETKDEGEEKQ